MGRDREQATDNARQSVIGMQPAMTRYPLEAASEPVQHRGQALVPEHPLVHEP